MRTRCTIRVSMELLSDTIFGSGFSIPGGEDIAVCCDDDGYPYLKGSTFKGLLRESLENWLVWTGGSEEDLSALMGVSDWKGKTDDRRLHLSDLRLIDPPKEPGDCFSTRAFTAIENGVAKRGSFHMAACVRSGSVFGGAIECDRDDAELVEHALSGIKWVGTMRSRGFGRVRFSTEVFDSEARGHVIREAGCLRYRLLTQAPVLITDLSRSRGNGTESRSFIPGSAIRGMVVSMLSEAEPEWFAANRTALLGGGTRFLDAVPICDGRPPLPSLLGFYEDKAETVFQTVVKNGKISSGLKRAGIGDFCAPDGETLRYWTAVSSGSTRISLSKDGNDTVKMFQTRYLEPGQQLEGYILLDEPCLAEQISKVFQGTVWLGADRYSGFGKCSVSEMEVSERPAWIDVYGYRSQEEIGMDLYLLAVSPFTMLDESGNPCGLDENALAVKMGVSSVSVQASATSVVEFGGYNRTWESRVPSARMYDRGSVFHLTCDRPPLLERLRRLESDGLGIRRTEGFGQILFLPVSLLEGLRRKEKTRLEKPKNIAENASRRREKYNWVMDHANELKKADLSKSQIGTMQTLFEKSIRKGGDLTELRDWLSKNMNARGARNRDRFARIDRFVGDVLDEGRNADVPEGYSLTERLELLCMLCDFSRKGGTAE